MQCSGRARKQCLQRLPTSRCSGFSLIELIAVLIILAVVSFSVFVKFSNDNTAAVQTARDQAQSAFFTAQQIAMARSGEDTTIEVAVAASSLNVTENGNSVAATGCTYPLNFPDGVTVTSGIGTYTYDKLGRTDRGQVVLTRGSVSATLRVEASGYVYVP